MKNLFVSASVLVLTSLSPAIAQAEPFTYSPDNCEFSITFPEKPFIQTKCTEDKGQKTCTDVVTYTKVANVDSSINFRVTCDTGDATELKKYTPAIMEETLKQMMKTISLEPYNIYSDDKDGYKQAMSLSVGEKNNQLILYSGQIRIGKTSIFTLESQIIGPPEETQEPRGETKEEKKLMVIYTDILRSPRPKDQIKAVTPSPTQK